MGIVSGGGACGRNSEGVQEKGKCNLAQSY